MTEVKWMATDGCGQDGQKMTNTEKLKREEIDFSKWGMAQKSFS